MAFHCPHSTEKCVEILTHGNCTYATNVVSVGVSGELKKKQQNIIKF